MDNLRHLRVADRHRQHTTFRDIHASRSRCYTRAVASRARIDPRFGPSGLAFEAWLAPENFDARGQQRRRLQSFQ